MPTLSAGTGSRFHKGHKWIGFLFLQSLYVKFYTDVIHLSLQRLRFHSRGTGFTKDLHVCRSMGFTV